MGGVVTVVVLEIVADRSHLVVSPLLEALWKRYPRELIEAQLCLISAKVSA